MGATDIFGARKRNELQQFLILFILELTLPTGIFILEFHQRIILESNVNWEQIRLAWCRRLSR